MFDDFPKLKIVVPHGGGAIPYHMGRFMAGRYPSRRDKDRKGAAESQYFENMAKRLHYDTCLYTPEALELLFKVMGANCCMFGTESPGAGSSINPHTGLAMDDLKPVIESFGWLTDADKQNIFEMNARQTLQDLGGDHGGRRREDVVSDTLLEFSNVVKRYGDTAVVDDISFTVARGEFFTLLGPSGCGKTTTLRLLAGLEIPTRARLRSAAAAWRRRAAACWCPPTSAAWAWCSSPTRSGRT